MPGTKRIHSTILLAGGLMYWGYSVADDGALGDWAAWSAQGQTELRGRFIERIPGAYVLIPDDASLPAVPLVNPKEVSPLALDQTLMIDGEYDRNTKQYRVKSYSLPTPASGSGAQRTRSGGTRGPDTVPSAAPDRRESKLSQDASRAVDTFYEKINAALQPGSMSANLDPSDPETPIYQAAGAVKDQLFSEFEEARAQGETGDQRRTDAVRSIARVDQTLKAIHGITIDNYPPWTYPRIFRNSRSVVAIAIPGEESSLCSGALIAKDLVITAAHCFEEHDPEELIVWFGYAKTEPDGEPQRLEAAIKKVVAPGPSRQAEMLQRARAGGFGDRGVGEPMLDFAILRIGRPNATGGEDLPPLCLFKHQLRRDRALYAIGYPKGQSQVVHDNGRVYLPFRLNERRFKRLQAEIESDFAMLEPAERMRLADEFLESYRAAQRNGGGPTFFELHDVRFGGQPKVGIIADMFRGDSGSPVFERSKHCVAGMHIGGSPDTGTRLGASWQTHETMLPIHEILAELEDDQETAPLLSQGILTIR